MILPACTVTAFQLKRLVAVLSCFKRMLQSQHVRLLHAATFGNATDWLAGVAPS